MKIKELALSVAIIILTIFVTFYGINTIYPNVEWDDYCGSVKVTKVIDTDVECVNAGGKWNYYEGYDSVGPRTAEDNPVGWCDLYSDCQKEYDAARADRSRAVFFIALPLGIIIILAGAFIFGIEAVGTGLIGGGIGTLIYGGGAFWPYTENWIRFLLSLVGLVILIWLVYYFTNRGNKKKK